MLTPVTTDISTASTTSEDQQARALASALDLLLMQAQIAVGALTVALLAAMQAGGAMQDLEALSLTILSSLSSRSPR